MKDKEDKLKKDKEKKRKKDTVFLVAKAFV